MQQYEVTTVCGLYPEEVGGNGQLNSLLNDGWEPFSSDAYPNSSGLLRYVVWLRRVRVSKRTGKKDGK